MKPYRDYWTMTALLACAALYAAHEGVITWGSRNFPTPSCRSSSPA